MRKSRFRKIKVDGCIQLGHRHELLQEPRPDPAASVQYVRSHGARRSIEVGDSDNLGQLLEFRFSDAPADDKAADLRIEGAGMVTSYGIFGAPGSGKTVLLMHLLKQLLAHSSNDPDKRYGALILDPKATLIDDVYDLVARAGRLDDLRILNTRLLNEERSGYNVIDCTLDPHELGAILVLAGRSAGIDASDPFWFQEWTNLFSASLSVLRLAEERREPDPAKQQRVTLRRLLDAIFDEAEPDGAAAGAKQPRVIQQIAAELERHLPEMPESQRMDLKADLQALKRFFGQDYVATIEAFVTKAFGMFRRSKLQCYSDDRVKAETPFYEDIVENGRIVVVSISPSEPVLAKTLSTLIKALFQRTVLARGDLLSSGLITNDQRPLVIACDEYSEIASEVPGQSMGDGQFLALARQYGCMALFATQSVNVLEASSLRDVWRSVFSNFGAKIYMRLVDNETAEEATKLAGESDWKVISRGRSHSGSGQNLSRDQQLRERKNLPTTVLTQVLKTGQGVVIGSLDGGATNPGTYYLQVPFAPPVEAAGILPRHR
jgi:TraM recognition site of TraD and TraG